MKQVAKLEQKQIQEQVEIHETLRTRCLEVVNSEDQVIARIGEETPETDEKVRDNKIATFFDDEGNEIACLTTSKFGITTFRVFGSNGGVSISSNGDVSISGSQFFGGGNLSLSYVDREGEKTTLSINIGLISPPYISVENTQGKRIDLKIDVDKGKVEIESITKIESESKEIRTSQTIFTAAE